MIILKMYEITFKKLMLYILIKQIILLNTPHQSDYILQKTINYTLNFSKPLFKYLLPKNFYLNTNDTINVIHNNHFNKKLFHFLNDFRNLQTTIRPNSRNKNLQIVKNNCKLFTCQ